MFRGQGFILDHLHGERHPLFTLDSGNNIFGGSLGRAKGVGCEAGLLDVTDSKDLVIAGAAGFIGLDPAGSSDCHCFDGIGNKAEAWYIANGDDNSFSRVECTIITYKSFVCDFLGHDRPFECSPKRFGVFLFLTKGKGFLDINQGNLLCTQPVAFCCNIAADVTGPNDYDFFAGFHGFVALGCLQVVKGGNDLLMAREGNGTGLMGTDRDYHVIEVLFQLLHFFPGHGDAGVDMDVRCLLEAGNLAFPNGSWQPLPGNGLGKFAADFLVTLKDMRFYSSQGKVPGNANATRATTYDGDFLAGWRSGRQRFRSINCLAEHRHINAEVNSFSGAILHTQVRADGSADRSRQRSVTEQHFICFIQFSFPDQA